MKNIKQWKKELLQGKRRYVVPIMTHPGIELCNAKVVDAVQNGSVHAEAIIQQNRTYPADAVTAIMDLTVEAEAFGAAIVFPEDEVPSVTGRLVYDVQTVELLQQPTLDRGRIQEYLKANRLTAQNVTDKPVFAGSIGPFSLAGRLYDLTETMMAIYTEPETINALLEKCAGFLTDYCRAIKETGVDGVIIAEPAAGLISNEDCSAFSSRYLKPLVNELQDDNFMIILHNCGNTGHCTEAMLEVGAMGYHFGNKANMTDILKQCPDDVLVMGNLDPVGIFKMASLEEVESRTKDLLLETSEYKNFVLSSGCDVPPHVSPATIEAFYKTLNEYNKQYRS
jgi:uroporphyrinogen decarboxylase